MSILSRDSVEGFLKYAKDQLKNNSILYEGRIMSSVEEITEENRKADYINEFVFAQQWILMNMPQLMENNTSMQRKQEELMKEKFEYYNRTKNYGSMSAWISATMKNIGFTDYEAETFMDISVKVGEKLFEKYKKEASNVI
ncbi:hypothetical protein IAI10_11210 [Clostridium sp. 19966]|uniref:hypothetical protein n=1 Tax=Clostridium sp. 19966 TaxID=2768166 RepID=UPI0028DD9BEB|nr:hypothetical protein [Clostridium sp. 19966]MDT8717226.1 hypothetical protein [Clostridium sp. 19966]